MSMKEVDERNLFLSLIVADRTDKRSMYVQIDGKRLTRWYQIPGILFAAILLLGQTTVSLPAASSNPQMAASSTALTGTPPIQPYSLPPEKLLKAVTLGRIRPAIHFGAEFWNLAMLWLLLATGTAARMGDWCAVKGRRRWLQVGLFSLLLVTLLFTIAELPVAAIGHAFSLHYGISVQGWPSWLVDEMKTLGVTAALETPALMLAFGLMRWPWSRRRYWLWFAVAAVPVSLLGAFLLPSVIEPIFYTYEPLAKSHPALVEQLERVVARTGASIPPERMFLMKASDKTNGLNAYVSGLGSSKRIVVWDTTADRMPTDEILFTFAHETGHYVLHHIPQGLAIGCVGMFALFWATARLAGFLARMRGSKWHVSEVASMPGLAVLLLALALLQTVTEPVENLISRHYEHEADVYGQEAIHGIVADPQKSAVASFTALGEAYLDDPDPNPFLVFWTYSHPSTQQRAIFASHYDPWAPGQTPRFFPR